MTGLPRTHRLADPSIPIRYTMPVGGSRIAIVAEPGATTDWTAALVASIAGLGIVIAALWLHLLTRVAAPRSA
jgi:hypothetical protein